MFLIHCETDNSYCKVEDVDVIYDEENIPNPGELVGFLWKNSKYNGTVIMQSDESKINKKLLGLNKMKKNQTTSDTASTSSVLPKTTKRVSKAVQRWSSQKKNNADNNSQKRRKRTANEQENKDASQNFIEKIVFGKDDKPSKLKKLSMEKSPSKDDLKKELEAMKSKLQAIEARENNKSTSKNKQEKKVDDTNNSSATTESLENSDLYVSDTEIDGEPLADEITKKKPLTVKKDDNKLINTPQKDKGETPVISGASTKIDIDNHGKLLHADGQSSEKDKEDIENKTKDDPEKEDDDKYYDEDIQLLGPDYCRKMVDIGDGIYCTEMQLNLAHNCGEGTVMIRQLMEGIFNKKQLLNCTYSGQPPRNLGKNEVPKIYRALHSKAKITIIKYTLKYAEQNGWVKKTKHDRAPYKWCDLQQAMTQKIGDIKRAHKKNVELKKK